MAREVIFAARMGLDMQHILGGSHQAHKAACKRGLLTSKLDGVDDSKEAQITLLAQLREKVVSTDCSAAALEVAEHVADVMLSPLPNSRLSLSGLVAGGGPTFDLLV